MTLEERIKENIECCNWESSEHEIICPYCGYKQEVEYDFYFGDNDINVYEEGDQDVKCPECGHTFELRKKLNWEYETEVKADE